MFIVYHLFYHTSMSFSVGIVGLPNAGKSTLFKALTKHKVDIAAFPFTTIKPNIGVVAVPDERLKKIAEIIKPEKITPTIIEFVDIAGLVKGAHKGQGLGNQFLAQIRNCDAIVETVRGFEDPKVEHIEGNVNPIRDMETIRIELIMKDLETLSVIVSNLDKEAKTKDKKIINKLELFKKLENWLSQSKLISELDLTEEEGLEIKEYQFLTAKPIIYLLNNGGKSLDLKTEYLTFNLKLEEEVSELSENEQKELEVKSQLDRLILACYNILGLITFFTVAGGKETRAWTLKKGLTAPEAGGCVHSDFKEKFIRAEVIPWNKLVEVNNWHKAKELGLIKTVGHDYVIEDGDIIEFRI